MVITTHLHFPQAHCNPLSHNDGFHYPLTPSQANWSFYYPNIPSEDVIVRHLDVGMGFGGLTVALAALFPDKLVLGMEIRAKVRECEGEGEIAGFIKFSMCFFFVD